MNEIELRKILSSNSENENIEYKTASNEYSILGGGKKDRKSLYGYCVGIGNSGGGKIIFGVDDGRKIVGTKAFSKIEEVKSQIYQYLNAKISIKEINTNEGRVVVVTVPPRQKGRLFKFYGTYLTRVGEELVDMNQDEIRDILHESIEDFTTKYLDVGIDVLDNSAIIKMRQMYENEHTGNESLFKLSDEQFLTDLALLKNGKVNNAAVILLGSESGLLDNLANAEIVFEYRANPSDIRYSDRLNLRKPLIFSLDVLWNKINSRNFIIPFTDGLVRREIPAFNESVVRESVLNAVVHRDYEASTSIFIKQDNLAIEIKNPGGFILDITPENIYKKSAWITKDVYDIKHQECREQVQLLEMELLEHQKADYDYQTTVATVFSVARKAKGIFEKSSDVAGKRAFLNYILQNPTVHEKTLAFSLRSPFNLVLELASPYLAPNVGRSSKRDN